MTDALRIGQVYASAAAELRTNTDQLLAMIQGDQINTPEFEHLWRQRDEAFTLWNNAAHLLRDLPVEGMIIVVNEINKMQMNFT